MKAKVLLVDDERNMLITTEAVLRDSFDVTTALGGATGLEKITSAGPFAVVVADRQMPEMDGAELLGKIKELSPETVRIMLTGNADLDTVIRIVNENNIFRFLTKPCPSALLHKAVQDAAQLHRLVVAEKELLNKTLDGSIKLLTEILSLLDSSSFGATGALRDVINSVTECLGLDNAWEIHLAAMLAPIGCVAVPPETLVRARSGQKLSKAEDQMLTQLPETAARLLANIPRLEGVAQIVRYQNKGFDGSGFPHDAVSGHAIPAGARLLRILLDYLELQRSGLRATEAFLTLRARSGRYDPAVLAVLKNYFEGKSARRSAAPLSIPVSAMDLARGMVLRSDVQTKDGMLILSAGTQLNDMNLEKILNFASVVGLKEPILVENVEPAVLT